MVLVESPLTWFVYNQENGHFSLSSLLYSCVATSPWTLIGKYPCRKTLLDNHGVLIKKHVVQTAILLDLCAFKQAHTVV